VVLAREFSISDSANPFYLKLRNSIPLAVLGHPARPPQPPLLLPPPPPVPGERHEGIRPRDFSAPLDITLSLSRPALVSAVLVLVRAAGRFYIFQQLGKQQGWTGKGRRG